MSYPNGAIFTFEVPSTQGKRHFNYEENLPQHTQDMSKQTFLKKILHYFLLRSLQGPPIGLYYSFHTFSKIGIKQEILT